MFKDAKVVMLPTNKTAGINCIYKRINDEISCIDENDKIGNLYINKNPFVQQSNSSFQAYHLYIITDDKILPHDWYIDRNGKLQQCESIKDNILTGPKSTIVAINEKGYNRFSTNTECKKIIATTDTSLKTITIWDDINSILIDNKLRSPDAEYSLLPQPSPEFINKYITEYNKGNIITDVLVEYNEVIDDVSVKQAMTIGMNIRDMGVISVLKIDSNNCITIKKKKSKLYTEEEVIQLLRDILYQSPYLITAFPDGTVNSIKSKEFDSWVKENLK